MYHLTGISLTPSATALDSLTEVAQVASSSEPAGMTPPQPGCMDSARLATQVGLNSCYIFCLNIGGFIDDIHNTKFY